MQPDRLRDPPLLCPQYDGPRGPAYRSVPRRLLHYGWHRRGNLPSTLPRGGTDGTSWRAPHLHDHNSPGITATTGFTKLWVITQRNTQDQLELNCAKLTHTSYCCYACQDFSPATVHTNKNAKNVNGGWQENPPPVYLNKPALNIHITVMDGNTLTDTLIIVFFSSFSGNLPNSFAKYGWKPG